MGNEANYFAFPKYTQFKHIQSPGKSVQLCHDQCGCSALGLSSEERKDFGRKKGLVMFISVYRTYSDSLVLAQGSREEKG